MLCHFWLVLAGAHLDIDHRRKTKSSIVQYMTKHGIIWGTMMRATKLHQHEDYQVTTIGQTMSIDIKTSIPDAKTAAAD